MRLSTRLSLFLLAAARGLLGASLTFHLHVCVDRVLIFLPEQTGVVFSKITLLSLADLATHDKPGAKLNGLWVNESGGRANGLASCQVFLAEYLERVGRLCTAHPYIARLESRGVRRIVLHGVVPSTSL